MFKGFNNCIYYIKGKVENGLSSLWEWEGLEVGGYIVGMYPHAPQNKLQFSTQSSTEHYVTKREWNKTTSHRIMSIFLALVNTGSLAYSHLEGHRCNCKAAKPNNSRGSMKPWSMAVIVLCHLYTIQRDPWSRDPWHRLSCISCTQFRGIRETVIHGSDYHLSLVHNSGGSRKPWPMAPIFLYHFCTIQRDPWSCGL
jgi:hypothetical protein